MSEKHPGWAEHRALWPDTIDDLRRRTLAVRTRFLLAGGVAGILATQLTPAAYGQTVSDRFLSRVTAQESGACATVSIDFNVPIRYTSHFPESSGRELRIGIQPLNFSRGSLSTALAAESIRPPASAIAGVQRITYDVSDPAGPTLVIQFDAEAHWQVEANKSVTRLVVTVSRTATCLPAGAAASVGASNSILSVTRTIPETLDPTGNYAINLLSERGSQLAPDHIRQVDAFQRHAAYAVTSEENGVQWARLRLGMFQTRAEAEAVLAAVAVDYPDAWVARIDRAERESVYQTWLAARGDSAGQAAALPSNPEADALLKELRDVLAAGDNAGAIRLADRILGLPENLARPAAQELLGLARERNGQLAHAKAEYEAFLQRYPTDEAAPRVRQRLSALLGEEPAPQQGKPAADKEGAGKAGDGEVHGEMSGSISALYQRDDSGFLFENIPVVGGPEVNPDPIEENRTNLNEVLYGADLNLSMGNDRVAGLFRFSGIYRDDLRTTAQRDEGAVSTLYFDISDREWNTSVRLGRQTRNTGGVFGRFDGGLLSFQANDGLKLNVVGGFPVQSSRDLEVNSSRSFWGASADISVIADVLDATVYTFNQSAGDLVDRQAAGLEFRYFDKGRSAFGIFDYDTHFGQMNLALLNGSLQFDDESSLTLALDYRRSPLLATQNAIIGQGVLDPNDLAGAFTEDQIYQLAQDRTSYSRSASVSYSRTLMQNLQFNADVIASNVSGTKTSAGVDGQPGTGTEYYYSAQLVASDVFTEGAILIAGVRYADLQLTNQYTLQFNGRYPMTRDLRFNTKLRLDQRTRKDGSGEDLSARGSIAITYNWDRTTHFDFELGGQYADNTSIMVTIQERGIFGSIGIRQDF